MITNNYLYIFLSSLGIISIIYLFLNFKPSKNNQISNKILLKNLLESLELELPDELKRLDNSTTDPHKL